MPPKEEDRIYPPPKFTIPLNDVAQVEGGKVHFEGRIEPVSDPTMRVQWFLNGNLIQASKYSQEFSINTILINLHLPSQVPVPTRRSSSASSPWTC